MQDNFIKLIYTDFRPEYKNGPSGSSGTRCGTPYSLIYILLYETYDLPRTSIFRNFMFLRKHSTYDKAYRISITLFGYKNIN